MADDVVLFHLIDTQLMAAGALGGLFHAFRVDKSTPRQAAGFLVVGGLAGNFITPGVLIIGGMAMNIFTPRALEMVIQLPPVSLAFLVGMVAKPLGLAIEMLLTGLLGKAKNE
jgi:hypothetical protein